MEAIAKIVEVERNQTRSGNTRFTVRDDQGHEYVTFRPPIGEQAERCRDQTARIEFHEEEKNGFRNVYLDSVEPVEPATEPYLEGAHDNADAAAWRAAAEVADVIVGDERVSGEELFEALKPFKDRVAEDIRQSGANSEERSEDARHDDEVRGDNVTPIRKPTKRATK